MNKKLIRLTESDLHRIVKESVNKILSEVSYGLAQRAYLKAANDPNRSSKQVANLRQGASNSFNREYGYNLKGVPYGSGSDDNMGVADPTKPFYGGINMYHPNSDTFQEFGGMSNGTEDPSKMYQRNTMIKNLNPSMDYDYEDKSLSAKDAFSNPKMAAAIMRGRNAVDKAHKGFKPNPDTWNG